MAKEAIRIIGEEKDGRWSAYYLHADDLSKRLTLPVELRLPLPVIPLKKSHFRGRTYTEILIPYGIYRQLKYEVGTVKFEVGKAPSWDSEENFTPGTILWSAETSHN